MSTNITINGIMFIVPNSARNAQSYVRSSDWDMMVRSTIRDLRSLGIDGVAVPERDSLVDVWVYSPMSVDNGSGNWADHGHPMWRREDDKRFPSCLPATLLAGKVEGDLIILKGEGMTFRLTCQQANSRYTKFGKFEEVFEKVTK